MMEHCPIPPPDDTPQNLDEMQVDIYPISSYSVAAWTPERDGKGKATQVHLSFTLEGMEDITFALRFKSQKEINRLILLLVQYRDEVWG